MVGVLVLLWRLLLKGVLIFDNLVRRFLKMLIDHWDKLNKNFVLKMDVLWVMTCIYWLGSNRV